MKGFAIIGALLGFLGFGDSNASSDLVIEHVKSSLESGATQLHLEPDGLPEWQVVHVLGPYTPLSTLSEPLSLDARVMESGIERRDDINVLVFVQDDKVNTVVELPRALLDVSPLADRTIQRGECLDIESDTPPRAVSVSPCT